jgi:hypothetical protein
MLANAVSRLDDSNLSITEPPCVSDPQNAARRRPVLHVVTLKGLRQVGRAFDTNFGSEARAQRQRNLYIAQWLSFFCCLVIVLPWLWIRKLQTTLKTRLLTPRNLTLVVASASLVMWAFAMRATYGADDPESGNALLYWSGAILLLAVCGLHICLKRLHECCAQANELPSRYRLMIVAGGVLACAMAALPALMRYLERNGTPAVLDQDLVMRLALDIGQGLAYHVVTAVGVFIVLFLMVALATGACIMTRNNGLLAMQPCNDNHGGLRTPRFPRACIGAMALIILLMALPSLTTRLGGARLSIFGPLASQIATFVLVITTLGASILTVVAIHSSRRIRAMAAHITRCLAPRPGRAPQDPEGENPGFWPPNDWQPNLFAATPVVVRFSPEDVAPINQGTTWRSLVSEFLGKCEGESQHNDGRHRRAVYALLASEISLYRWFVGGAVLCAIASVCAAYLFPLEADPLIMWNLGVLVAHALLAGYVATAFERDGVLSNILCNKPKKAIRPWRDPRPSSPRPSGRRPCP